MSHSVQGRGAMGTARQRRRLVVICSVVALATGFHLGCYRNGAERLELYKTAETTTKALEAAIIGNLGYTNAWVGCNSRHHGAVIFVGGGVASHEQYRAVISLLKGLSETNSKMIFQASQPPPSDKLYINIQMEVTIKPAAPVGEALIP